MKPDWKRRGAVLLADAVLLFLGLYGVTASFLTAFRLAPDAAGLGFACLILSGLACLVFSVRKLWCRLALYLGWFALLAGWARAALDKLILGALLAAQQVGTVCAEQLPGIPPPDLAHYVQALTAAEQTEYLTLLFCAILGVLAFLLGWAVVYRRSFWCALLLTAPILTVPLVFTLTPRWSALVALLLFWGAGLLTRLPRKKDPYGTAKLTLLVLPPLLLALAVLGSLLPRNGYRQPPKVAALRMEITRRVYETGRELAAGQLSGTTLMGGGGTEADLAQAGPLNFTGRAALRVESEKTGHIYLRGCSAGIYEDSKWLQIPAEAYPQMEYQPMNFPALQDVQASPQHGTTRVVVENVGAAGAYVYTPYQLLTTPERMGGAEFVTDAYLARGDGIWRHILYARDEAKPGDALHGGAGEAERTYAQFVREQYLQVPRALQNKLPPEPLRGAFEQDPLAAAQAVA
ncbi:MAG: transglutaminaseTgpA domain-containing protein, partial [Pseudoflavonifractor sp.]